MTGGGEGFYEGRTFMLLHKGEKGMREPGKEQGKGLVRRKKGTER